MHTTIRKEPIDVRKAFIGHNLDRNPKPTMTLGLLRRMKKEMEAHEAVVFFHSDLEPDMRDLLGFVPAEYHGYGERLFEQEIGRLERMRFVYHPDLPFDDTTYGFVMACCPNGSWMEQYTAMEPNWVTARTL